MSTLSSLSSIIYDSLQGYNHYSKWLVHGNHTNKSSYMIIPVFGKSFELPTFAINSFQTMCNEDLYVTEEILANNAICVHLETKGRRSSYASLDSQIRDTFHRSFQNEKLIQLRAKNGTVYYLTSGAIFDDTFHPIAMLSWMIEKVKDTEGYRFVRPILRIDPDVYTSKEDDVQRYIINKIITETLKCGYESNPYIRNSILFNGEYNRSDFIIQIVLEKFPFTVVQPDKPSVSTTNKELLTVALNNINEIVQ